MARHTRQLNPCQRSLPDLEDPSRLSDGTVLDGELCILDAAGKPAIADALARLTDVGRAADRMALARPAVFLPFDMLWLEGRDLRRLPLIEHKDLLSELITTLDAPSIQATPWTDRYGLELFQQTTINNMEGIVAKKASSRYLTGRRSGTWRKIKNPGYERSKPVVIQRRRAS